ncbi:helix-turn-helix transcriptional regulator [Myroides sp. 1354]|uniref:winged helix-turn-helix transcriptional regulator n=1 Tax=unclassified Myroides TaxID=2642485 RepID=UPI00257637A1|nr:MULTISPECIES: helix-turn-helix domain-containing protein [unclassified Myroides]MDM1044479.1 helix-turn-helix transcriptional regulator [Myroides sp. R163-1]MDM1056820.1 helix-turn-helix transcriptional regulator [Myroides sp. 1354]MDM1069909.1 helix-turn-helix transcriptional regulator [Myroides sp. 1372]
MQKQIITEKVCPLEYAVKAISGKWKIPIIWRINEGEKRPSEFLRGIATVDRRVLNQQLKELEDVGILNKTRFDEVPPRVEYTLTPIGIALVEVLKQLNRWGEVLLDQQTPNPEDNSQAKDYK